MKTAIEVLDAFENIRRAQRAGVYAPHKPLLILLALARVQRGEPRMVEFTAIDALLKQLLAEFGPSSAAKSRHYPFWHLATDGHGALWDLSGPREGLEAPRRRHAQPGRTAGASHQRRLPGRRRRGLAPRSRPAAGRGVAGARYLLSRDPARRHRGHAWAGPRWCHRTAQCAAACRLRRTAERRRRDPGFRERVLRAYEYRCCVCGFDLRIGHTPAGLEAAHIQWHHVGGPDIEPNGLSLCALHHKLFDLGVFTVEPAEHRVVFSQHAISGGRGMERRASVPRARDPRAAAR